MRGANIHGAAPVLDFEGGAAEPTTFMTAAAEEDAVAEEALARMQEQMTQAAALSHQGARAALQAQLDQNDEEGEAQRRALNGYLEELKGREDEAGDRIRAAEFTQEVDALVEEQRRAAADAAGPHVHDIIQHVHDPRRLRRCSSSSGSTRRSRACQRRRGSSSSSRMRRHPPPNAASSSSSRRRATPPRASRQAQAGSKWRRRPSWRPSEAAR